MNQERQGNHPSQGPDAPSGSLGGVMRMIVAATVLVLAIAGVLVVLDLVQLDEAGRAAGKLLVVMLIIGMASVLVGLLMRRNPPR